MKHALCTMLSVLFLTLVSPAHAETQGFHPSLRVGAGLAGQIFGGHGGYDFQFLQVTDATLDYEFCLRASCRVFVGPYIKLSFFTAPQVAGRIAGGLVTGVSLNDHLAIFGEIGLGQATQDIRANSLYSQSAATYDLTLGVRHQLPGKKISLLAGVTHESNGHAQGANFFVPTSKDQARFNIGLTHFWVGIGFPGF